MVEFRKFEDPGLNKWLLFFFDQEKFARYNRQQIRKELQWQNNIVSFRGDFDLKIGRYEVNYLLSGTAKVIDRDAFMEIDAGAFDFPEKFAIAVNEYIKQKIAELGYRFIYFPTTGSHYDPEFPSAYRVAYDKGKLVDLVGDEGREELVKTIVDEIPLILGCKVDQSLAFSMHRSRGDIIERNFKMIPNAHREKALKDPYYLDYMEAVAVTMTKKAAEISKELDEQRHTSDSQPLHLHVRRVCDVERIIIRWEIPRYDLFNPTRPFWFTELAALKLFVVQYQTEVPMRTREFPPNSHKWISGSDQANGQIEIKLKPGQTAYFGAWVEGFKKRGERGYLNPKPIYGEWCPEHAITFSVYMPEPADSPTALQKQVEVAKAKATIREHDQTAQPRSPREEPLTAEVRRSQQARYTTRIRLRQIDELQKDLDEVCRQTDKEVEEGLRAREDAERVKEDAIIAYNALMDDIRNRMAS